MQPQEKMNIIVLHKFMKKFTIESGVKEKQYDSVILDLEEFNEFEITQLHDWLSQIRWNEFNAVKNVKDLLPDHIWERYKLFEITGLREQDMLKDAQEKLKRKWEHPYRSEKQMKRRKSKKSIIKHKM